MEQDSRFYSMSLHKDDRVSNRELWSQPDYYYKQPKFKIFLGGHGFQSRTLYMFRVGIVHLIFLN